MIAQEKKQPKINHILTLTILWLFVTVSDRLWFAFDNSVPAWDQADYLTGSLTYWRALQNVQLFSGEWWKHFWELSPKVPPLTYILTVPFQNIFGRGADEATLVHLFFSGILLTSVYSLGSKLFNQKVGFWAAVLCILFPGLYRYRLQFLLDYPLTAMVTLNFCCLTFWYGKKEEGRRKKEEGRKKVLLFLDREEGTGKREQGGKKVLLFLENFIGLVSAKIDKLFPDQSLKDWLWVTAFGLTFGLAILVKQTTIFFLFTPLLWIGINILKKRQWYKLIQLIYSLCLSVAIFYPWARTNWLLMLTAGKRATVDSAIAEGDPNLLSLDAWIYYGKLLPYHISLPLLIIPIGGLIFYFIRLNKKQQNFSSQLHSFQWIAIFLIGGYLICSLNINKDFRYTLPLLPVLSILLAFGLMQFPGKVGKQIRYFTVGLAIILMLLNLWPVGGIFLRKITTWLSPGATYYAHFGKEFPHRKVIAEIVKTDPYLQSTLGVLPSTPEINQHNLNYYGALQNLQVYGRQVGTNFKQVEQDARSLSWFVTKTDEQGSVKRIKKAQAAIVNLIEQHPNFKLQKSWQLPDNSNLNLYHNQFLPIEVNPLNKPQEKVKLDYIILSPKIRPGTSIPITYKWSGSWQELQSGLVLLTYRRENINQPQTELRNPVFPKNQVSLAGLTQKPGLSGNFPGLNNNNQGNKPGFLVEKPITQFIHDRAIGMGSLHPGMFQANESEVGFEVIERIGMLPPSNIVPGTYLLEATYLNRETGASYPIAVQPPVRVEVDPQAQILPAPELDLVTQLRMWGQKLPLGIKGLETVFAEVARVNQYDPVQDYTEQAEQTLTYRLQQEPDNLEWLYSLALAQVLQKDAEGAIATLTRITELDSQNPFAYAYLAFVYLYELNPGAAEIALKSALEIDPDQPEIRSLNGIAALMQGNLVQAWRELISQKSEVKSQK
ncbi:phospholipid carrier-dependent glycosyltransferase [Dapis sp. BLCC M172]|uniref:phospholipid carrier-dependent glycosyltransferase n=1 Tax=Dapis sp. BLCC M172 TaxID=2975281 RepID=UPI003CF93046